MNNFHLPLDLGQHEVHGITAFMGHEQHVPLEEVTSGISTGMSGNHVPLEPNDNTAERSTADQFTNTFIEQWDDFFKDVHTVPALPTLEVVEERKGKAATVQKFYEGRPTCKCCTNWIEKQPQTVPDEAQEKYDGVAVRIYHGKDHSKETLGGLKNIAPTFIVIQSPIILRALEPIFDRIGRPSEGKGSISVSSPFQDLFFAHSDLVEAYNECEPDSEEKRHLGVLKEVTDELLRETTDKVTDLQAKKLMTYQYLWTLFPKGIVVVSKIKGQECLFEVTSYEAGTASIHCRHIAFDGSVFGIKRVTFCQPLFLGARPVCELVAYPLSFHAHCENLEKIATRRSRKVLFHQGIAHAEYRHGRVDFAGEQQTAGPAIVSERIIIDPFGYCKFRQELQLDRLVSDDTRTDEKIYNLFQEKASGMCPSPAHVQANKEIVSSKSQWLLLLDPFIRGYSLRTHHFDTFYVDHIQDVKWNDQAFNRLVFSEDSKELLLTLVKNHGHMRDVGRDLISGKGQGFVVLLSGPPGTGKTLTAEAVADQANRPLFRIQAETLGRHSEDIEEQLEEAFKLATEWDALLLIDEADAYLGAHQNNGERDSLVRVLMTRLEYYRGVLFLTTNFPDKIDEAFSSRIDVHFQYPNLDRSSRRQLLEMLINFAASSHALNGTPELTEQDYWDLAAWELNGREIKNAVKIACRLCSVRRERLSHQGLETAIRH